MLEINLVPKNLRKKRKSHFAWGEMKIPLEVVVGIGGGFVFLLIFVHVLLLIINISCLTRHKMLKNEWTKIIPQKEKADSILSQLRNMQLRKNTIKGISPDDINSSSWAVKLNILSDVLPNGVWLKKVALSEKILFVEGSSISTQNRDLLDIHHLITSLKNSNAFLENLTSLDLGTIQRRKIRDIEIIDFLITARVQ